MSDIQKIRERQEQREREIRQIVAETIRDYRRDLKQMLEPLGRCCYGGMKRKSDCASCAAWSPANNSLGVRAPL